MDAQILNYDTLLANAKNLQEIELIKVKFLGRNGLITNELKALANLDIEEKKIQGKKLNEIKLAIEDAINKKIEEIEFSSSSTKINEIDYTIASKINLGKRHIISASIEKLNHIFAVAGFTNIIGPDIEDVFYNFEALNIPAEHPARDNQDTFYMNEENKLLRTHVTCVQIRLLEKMKNLNNKSNENLNEPPIVMQNETRSYSIGRVYRNDAHDSTHACMFHQVEGIIIENGVTMQHLKGFLEYLFSEFFEQSNIKIRFRPSHFPFTEPSCEVDVFTKNENGKLIITNDGSGKPLEIGGCGIIHPTILDRFDLSEKQAFAFGMGLERMIMIKHGITNLHDLYNNHIPTLRYISQY